MIERFPRLQDSRGVAPANIYDHVGGDGALAVVGCENGNCPPNH